MQPIGKTLQALRKANGYSQPEIPKLLEAQGCPFPSYSVSRWETGRTSPSIEQFLTLCKIYHVQNVVETFLYGQEPKTDENLNSKGREKLMEYRDLLIASGLYVPERDKKVLELPRRTIVHYELPASAGHGVFLDSEDYEQVEVGPEVPLTATFGVSISGDSMEPEYHHGDSIWVHQQQTLDSGEIGLFMLNGQAFLKQLRYEKGIYSLVSLNSEYAPIRIEEADTFRVMGKVVATTPRP